MSLFQQMCAETGRVPLDYDRISKAERDECLATEHQFISFNAAHAQIRNPDVYINFGFLDNSDVNACAFTWNGADFVAVNIGVIRELKSLYSRFVQKELFEYLSNDDERDAAAEWMFECSKHMILIHELGHVWRGHTSWVLGSDHRYLSEMQVFPVSEEESLHRRTLEMDADSFAATNVIELAMRNPPTVNPAVAQRWGDRATAIWLCAIAVYISRRIFYKPDEITEEKGTHPSLPLRNHILSGTITSWFLQRYDESQPLIEALQYGLVSAERLVMVDEGSTDDSKFFDDIENGVWWGRSKVLLRNWHNLYPILMELKRGGQLPLPQHDLDD